jgi:leucyl aminopeptidase
MKIGFEFLKSVKDIKDNTIVSIVSEDFVSSYSKKRGRCECKNNCKCGEICTCKKTPLQQVIYDSDFKGNTNQSAIASTSFGKIIFYGIGRETDIVKLEKIGYNIFRLLKKNKEKKVAISFETLFEDGKENGGNKIIYSKNSDILRDILNGFLLGSYSFDKYLTGDKLKNKTNPITFLNIITDNNVVKNTLKMKELEIRNVFLCRDLINEPANVIYPESIVKIVKEFSKLNIKVDVLDEKELKKLGCGTLLSVGQGSSNPSYMVSLEYNGGGKNNPIAFVGKGVTFDSGGLNIKTGNFMDTMKCDMSGASVVISLIKLLAERKAKVNAVGVIALVENMPSGTATKVGDIVKSMSGQTVEVTNTDAEGRMILADALYYTIKKFNPQTVIDLATLTGAICVALGEEYTGLFTNNDELEKEIKNAGKTTNEKCWRMPLSKIGGYYDEIINSDWADVKNSAERQGGAITAAQFLQRFIDKHKKWAHLDIAATAFVNKSNYFVEKGATGWGVRLLNELVKNNYENK